MALAGFNLVSSKDGKVLADYINETVTSENILV